jgi:hypothetical protein
MGGREIEEGCMGLRPPCALVDKSDELSARILVPVQIDTNSAECYSNDGCTVDGTVVSKVTAKLRAGIYASRPPSTHLRSASKTPAHTTLLRIHRAVFMSSAIILLDRPRI